MSNDLINTLHDATMTLKEIAVVLELSRKDNIVTSAQRLHDDGVINLLPCAKGTKINQRLNKVDSITLVAQNNAAFTKRIVQRWLNLEDDLLTKHQATLDRATMRLEYRPMTDAIKSIREEAGKESKHFHYSNEADMINKVLTGFTAKKYKEHHDCKEVRDNLTPVEKAAMVKLQQANTIWIEEGYTFSEREDKLKAFYQKRLLKPLTEENIALNA